ncbi:hypothetical protein [Jannaschia marina]|uniref:hypothetical protein n=1 Tax=Jannaschia marina TaxID=2741674 RepID=UPI001F27B16D|nr:hypothetical protein [Jannaschia marina]
MTKTQKMMNGMFATLVGVALMTTALPAGAQGASCGPRDAVVERLSGHFGETRRGIGIGTQNRVVEVFASDDTGTWTITVTLPDGRMCLVASGQSWEDRMDDLAHLADAKT